MIKLNNQANILLINAAECEPYITCDDILIRRSADEILQGAQIAARIIAAEQIVIGIEEDKPEAIAAFNRAIAALGDARMRMQVIPLRYPSGNARQLVELVFGRRIAANIRLATAGIVCHNPATLQAIYEAVICGKPLLKRWITLTGAVAQAGNILCRIGTPVRELLATAGGLVGLEESAARLLLGGPMMGVEIADWRATTDKTSNCLLFLERYKPQQESPCIRCSRCAAACPMCLLPQQLYFYARAEKFSRLEKERLFDCSECGVCASVCPAKIELVEHFRLAKASIRKARNKEAAKEQAKLRYQAKLERLSQPRVRITPSTAPLQSQRSANLAASYLAQTQNFDPTSGMRASSSSSTNSEQQAAIAAAKERAQARRAARLEAKAQKTDISEQTEIAETNTPPIKE